MSWVERMLEHFHPREVAMFAELEGRVAALEKQPTGAVPQSLLNAVSQLEGRVTELERPKAAEAHVGDKGRARGGDAGG